MTTTTKEAGNVLNGLIETLKNGELGFKSAAEDVKTPEIKKILNQYSTQREQFARSLQAHVEQLGEKAEDSGSIAGALHRGWINLKSAVVSRDALAVLEECEQGEDYAVKAYRDALAGQHLDGTRSLVEGQFAHIRAAHDHVRKLRDSLKPAL